MCDKKPGYFRDGLDMIIDNKGFDIPTTERARKYLNSQLVRFHLRTPAEGLKNEFTKPGRKKNRMNTGARANVCAGVSNGRIVLWHYLPKSWTGQAAAGPVQGRYRSYAQARSGRQTVVPHSGGQRPDRLQEQFGEACQF